MFRTKLNTVQHFCSFWVAAISTIFPSVIFVLGNHVHRFWRWGLCSADHAPWLKGIIPISPVIFHRVNYSLMISHPEIMKPNGFQAISKPCTFQTELFLQENLSHAETHWSVSNYINVEIKQLEVGSTCLRRINWLYANKTTRGKSINFPHGSHD